MVKLVTLFKRRPELAVEDFHRALLAHAAVERAAPGLRRYVQSHTLLQGYRRGELLFDGVTEALFATLEEAEAARAAAGPAVGSAFADTGRTRRLLIDVHVAKDGPPPAGAVKNIEFVNRRPGMPLDAFHDYWRDVHGPIGSRIPTILRYEQNHLHPAEYGRDPDPPYDGLAITWFASTAEMRRGAETPEYAVTREDEVNFLPDGHLPIIITREVLDTAGA